MGASRFRRRLAVVVANLIAVGGVVALAAAPAHAAPAVFNKFVTGDFFTDQGSPTDAVNIGAPSGSTIDLAGSWVYWVTSNAVMNQLSLNNGVTTITTTDGADTGVNVVLAGVQRDIHVATLPAGFTRGVNWAPQGLASGDVVHAVAVYNTGGPRKWIHLDPSVARGAANSTLTVSMTNLAPPSVATDGKATYGLMIDESFGSAGPGFVNFRSPAAGSSQDVADFATQTQIKPVNIQADAADAAMSFGTLGADVVHTFSGVSYAIPAPANDLIANATSLGSAASGSVSGTNVQASAEAGEQTRDGNTPARSVWWRWTAPSTGTATFDTVGSSFDTVLGAQAGTAINGTLLAANDDIDTGGDNVQSRVSFPVTASSVYSIAVDGFIGSSGAVTLNWTLADTTKPSVTINKKFEQSDPTTVSPIHFTVFFNEPVTGFTLADVSLSGTAGATTKVVTGSGASYNVAVSGMTGSGTVVATVPAGGAADAAGNTNNASTSTDNSVQFNVVVAPAAGAFTPVAPARVLDTRPAPNNVGAPPVKVAGGGTVSFQVAGAGGVPAGNVAGAVVLNVAVTGASAAGFITAFPSGETKPTAANLNFAAGQTISNHVTVKVGADGKASLFNGSSAPIDLIADVNGWYVAGAATQPGTFTPLTPKRLLDTRPDPFTVGVTAGKIPGQDEVDFSVAGVAPIPAESEVGAGVFNVAITGPTAGGFITAFPTGATRPLAANLNFVNAQTISNAATVKLGTGGKVSLFNGAASGSADLIADANGWFRKGTAAVAGAYTPLDPARILDTRPAPFNVGAPPVKVAAGASVTLTVAGAGGVPANGAGAAVFNLAVTGATAGGFITAHPADVAKPLAANLNFSSGETISNLVTVKLSATGQVKLFNGSSQSVNLIADVAGWYKG